MIYWVEFEDKDAEDRLYAYSSKGFSSLERARDWKEHLDPDFRTRIVEFDKDTNSFEVVEED